MKTLSLALITMLVSNSALALDVRYVEQGKPAPITGFVIDAEAERHFRLLDQKLQSSESMVKAYESIVLAYDKQEQLLNKRIELCQEQNEKLAKPKSVFGSYGHFLLGAATAVLIMFAHGKINR